MRRRTRKRNLLVAVVVAVPVACGIAGYAVAGQQAEAVPSYTGCLKNGKLDSLALGDSPLVACGAGAVQVRLGGGDVTAVTAGTGLTGGGDGGDLTVAADASILQERVTDGCLGSRSNPTDASIGAIHADGSVICNPDDTSAGTEVVSGFADGPGNVPSGETPQPVRQLPLPKGKYAISATFDVSEGLNLGLAFVQCELRAGPDFDRTEIDFAGVLNAADGTDRVALSVVHEFVDPGSAVLSCRGPTDPGPARWHFLKITAIRVQGLSNGPLALP
jgi:hypothetical protein